MYALSIYLDLYFYLEVFVYIYILTYIYIWILQVIYQRAGGQNIDSSVQCRPSLGVRGKQLVKGNTLCTDTATALSHPAAIRGFLGRCPCSQRSLRGGGRWEQRGGSRTGTGMGMGEALTCTLPAGSPAMPQVSPAATQPSWGRRGRGRGGEAWFPD